MSLPFTTSKTNKHLDEDQSTDLEFFMSLLGPADQKKLMESLKEAVNSE